MVDPGKLSWLVGRWRLCLLHPGAWWSAGGLTVVVIALLPDALRGWTIAADDIQYFFFAQNHAIANSVAHGAWPLWDPLFGFGQPLLANPGNQALYPPSWINLLWPPEIAIVLYVGGHLLLAGLGTYALARRILHLSPWASWLAAACWIASGPLVSLVPRWQHFASAAWLPWVLLAALRCAAGPSTLRALMLAATLVLQWLSGSVEVAAAALLIALL